MWYRIINMSEKYTTTKNEQIDDGSEAINAAANGDFSGKQTEDDNFDMNRAARISQTSIFDKIRDTVSEHKAAAIITVGVLGGVGYGAGQAAQNSNAQNERVASAAQSYEHNESVQAEIKEKAHDRVRPESIVGIFDIEPNTTISELSEEIVEKQPQYQEADQKEKDFIDYTVLESGKAQGSYDVKDTFVVSKDTIDGKDTLIVQDGEDIANELTAPDTH